MWAMKMKKVLLAVDVATEDHPSKRLAVALAKQHGAELLLYHAVITHERDLRRAGELLEDLLSRALAEATSRLEKESTRLEKDHGIVARSLVERHPSAFEAIRDQVGKFGADLVVMGTHGRSGMERWFMGSVAEKVVRHVPVPVVTVRPEWEPQELGRVLVPVDFSENSRRALEAASALAGTRAELVLQHVVLNPAFAGIHPGEYVRLFQVDTGLPARIREQMDDWMEGRPYEAEIREADDVSESIVEVAKEREADLIAIGSRGLTGLDYFLMGSVAEKVLRRSLVPVLTVK